jgi:hypothetical protein
MSTVDLKCPFCGDGNFDAIGLKNHLLHYREVFAATESI